MANANQAANDVVLRDLQVGDLVEIQRVGYFHWGVYIGNETIVHMCRDDANDADGHAFFLTWARRCGEVDSDASVKEENFWDVVKDSVAKKNNSKDEECDPLRPDEIKDRAESKIGSIPYSILWNDCENFAAWCRYDRHSSDEIDQAVRAGGGGYTCVNLKEGATVIIAGGRPVVVYNGKKDDK